MVTGPKRFSGEGTSYYVADPSASYDLVSDLDRLVGAVFKKASTVFPSSFGDCAPPLVAAINVVVDEYASSCEWAADHAVETELNGVIADLNQMYLYLLNPSSGKISNRLAGKDFAKTIKARIKRLTDLKQSLSEQFTRGYFNHLQDMLDIVDDGIEDPCPQYSVAVTLHYSALHSDLQSLFPEWQEMLKQSAKEQTQKARKVARTKVSASLQEVSTALCTEYKKVVGLSDEAQCLAYFPVEDEYFLEQAHTDYIPRILTAVQNMEERNSVFEDKEALIAEAVKQFRIIGAGIQRIIEKNLTTHLDVMKSETGFLIQKVLGDEASALIEDEAQEQLEEEAAEATRLRSALYREYVSPALQANREFYERSLDSERKRLRAEFEKELKGVVAWHTAEMADLQVENGKLTNQNLTLISNAKKHQIEHRDREKSLLILERNVQQLRELDSVRQTLVRNLRKEVESLKAALKKERRLAKKMTPVT